MIKNYCDCCGKEITGLNVVYNRVKGRVQLNSIDRSIKYIPIHIICGIGDNADIGVNVGDLCESCLLKAILSLFNVPIEKATNYVAINQMKEWYIASKGKTLTSVMEQNGIDEERFKEMCKEGLFDFVAPEDFKLLSEYFSTKK